MKARGLLLVCVATFALSAAGASTGLAAPEPPGPGGVTDLATLTVINTVGDDVFAATDLVGLLDPAGTKGTKHYGPFPSSSTDSGTCGNDWANDTFDRHFTVHSDANGVRVVEQFKNGDFTTFAGLNPSPGGCDTNPGGTVNGGVTGSLQGYFIISNTGPQTNFSPFCDANLNTNANCTTERFINTHFTPCYPATCTVTTFLFNYSANDQGLVFHHWKNASADRGGNNGDIANT